MSPHRHLGVTSAAAPVGFALEQKSSMPQDGGSRAPRAMPMADPHQGTGPRCRATGLHRALVFPCREAEGSHRSLSLHRGTLRAAALPAP